MSLKRATAPDDLRITDTLGPRGRTATWQVGDIVTVGRERWVIRTLIARGVELEALSTIGGIWWTTTIDRLPEKAI